MQTQLRSHTCGELRAEHIGQAVRLCGWVQRVRDLGQFSFVDLRDRYGLTQLAVWKHTTPELYAESKTWGREWVLQVQGEVFARESPNAELPTGAIEIRPEQVTILSQSDTPPFLVEDETDGQEDLRLAYRYLDLRRPRLQHALALRAQLVRETRNYLDGQAFLEVETPCLIKSTPEGARDFLVPSRLQPGNFYALPQSPQLLKQLLMVAGCDRYYQIVKCFRDEDFRGDRQPEFTQIDCEMAFVEQEDVLQTFEGLFKHLFRTVAGVELPTFARLPYQEALARYGTDKPDLRFGVELHPLNNVLDGQESTQAFPPFHNTLQGGGSVQGLAAPGLADYTRKQLDKLVDFVKQPHLGLQGLVWVKYAADGSWKSSVDKFFGPEQFEAWAEVLGAQPGDLLLLAAGPTRKVQSALGALRLHLAKAENWIPENAWSAFWVVDFPLFEFDEDTGEKFPAHHPFVMPHTDDWEKLQQAETLPQCRALCYDLVINGNEIGSGSVRIHRRDLQAQLFELLGMDEAEQQEKFGFLLEAYRYGAPPHAGVAFGLDRLVMLLAGGETIRDVMAFPKTAAGRDAMLDAPGPVPAQALKELYLDVKSTQAS